MMRPGSSGEPYQDAATYVARTGGLEGILEWHVRHSRRGHKGRCDTPAITSGIPRVPGVLGRLASRGCDVLWLDYDGIRVGDIPRIKAYLEKQGWEYVYVTTSSYDAENGLFKVRFFLAWSRRASVREHSTAVLELMTRIAEDLGHEVPAGRKQQKEWLASIGHDPQSTVAATPASVRRWGSARIAAQADAAHSPGEPVDLDRLIAAARGRRRATKAIARISSRGGIVRRTTIGVTTRQINTMASRDTGDSEAGGSRDTAGGVDAANAALDGIGALHPGCGDSDAGLWRAAIACRSAGLSADEILEVMLSRYVPQGQPASRIAHKARDAARAPRRRPGDLQVSRDGSTLRLESGVYVERMRRQHLPPIFASHPGEVMLTRAACGTGKTYRLRSVIRRILEKGGRVVVVVHRRALARSLSAELGLPCYLDTKGKIRGSCVIVLDSIRRIETLGESDDLEPVDLSIDLLIVDESEQVARHLFGGTILDRGRVLEIWACWREVCRVALAGIWQDADLGALTQEIVRLLHPRLKPWIQINEYQKPIRALILESADGKAHYWARLRRALRYRLEHRKHWTPKGGWCPPEDRGWIPPANPLHEFCSSRSMANGHKRALLEEYPEARILVIDRDRTGLDDASAALSDTSKWAEYDMIITTTACGSGVSVPVECEVFVWAEAGDGNGRRRGHLQGFAEYELWQEGQRECVADRDAADILKGGALTAKHRCQRGRVRAALLKSYGWERLEDGLETPASLPAPATMAKVYALARDVLGLNLEDGLMAPMRVLGSSEAIARALEAAGFPPRGSCWHRRTVHRLLARAREGDIPGGPPGPSPQPPEAP